MRFPAVALTCAALAAACASPAGASWSAPKSLAIPQYAAVAHAVNARGDVAVAWATRGSPAESPVFRTSIHVTTFPANGRVRTRQVWSSRTRGTVGVAAGIDRRGEVTVAWIAGTRREQLSAELDTKVRAAYGGLSGRWAPAHVVGDGADEAKLAVGPDGSVLLAWVGSAGRTEALGSAWRAPGRRFGKPSTLYRPRPKRAPSFVAGPPIPAFDAGGAAYLHGECDGVVRRAPARTHRFGPPIVVTRATVLGFSLSVAEAGRGVASWIENGSCTADEAAGSTPGRVSASLLSGSRFGPPLALPSTAEAYFTSALAVPGGGRTVSWSELGEQRTGVFGVPVGATGALGPAQPLTDGLVPFLADGSGDQILTGVFPGPPSQVGPGGVVVRPAGGGADEPAPATSGQLAVAAPVGRRFALLWTPPSTTPGDRMLLSVWLPG